MSQILGPCGIKENEPWNSKSLGYARFFPNHFNGPLQVFSLKTLRRSCVLERTFQLSGQPFRVYRY